MAQYLEQITGTLDVLSYWRLNRNIFPKMAQLDKKVMATPATARQVNAYFQHEVIVNRQTLSDERINT